MVLSISLHVTVFVKFLVKALMFEKEDIIIEVSVGFVCLCYIHNFILVKGHGNVEHS